jgi:hypothetical protein
MVALLVLKDPPVGALKGPLLMVIVPTLKDPPVGGLKGPMLMVGLPTLKDLRKEPPTDLMERLANLEARRHQVSVVLFTKPELVFRLLSI